MKYIYTSFMYRCMYDFMQVCQLKEGGYVYIMNDGRLWISLTDGSLFEAV